jgi:hypothetical protein
MAQRRFLVIPIVAFGGIGARYGPERAAAVVKSHTAGPCTRHQPGTRWCRQPGAAGEDLVISGRDVSSGAIGQDVAIPDARAPRGLSHVCDERGVFNGGAVMLKQAKVAATFFLVSFLLMAETTRDARAGSVLPDATKASVAEKLFRLDCGRSLANDESVWTPGENVGRSIDQRPRTTTREVGLLYLV